MKAVNFLDVTLNLATGEKQLYNKPDNNLFDHIIKIYIYIYIYIRNLPENVSKTINTLSADATTFNKFKDLYNASNVNLNIRLHFKNRKIHSQ